MKINFIKLDKFTRGVWIIPVILLIIFSEIIGIILISNPHDFWWGMLSTIIGIFITVFWINFLLPLQDKKRWNVVKGSIYEEFGHISLNLFGLIRMYIHEGILSISGEEPTQKMWDEKELKKLEDLANNQKITLNKTGEKLFKGSSDAFSDYLNNLNNFEIKYARFIEPKEQNILIRLQKTIRHIVFLIDNTKLPSLIGTSKEKFEEILPRHFSKTIVLINELRKEGIEFFV